MRDEAGFLTCARCRDRIGVYERTLWADPRGSLLEAPADTDPPAGHEPLHRDCGDEPWDTWHRVAIAH